MIEVFPFAGLPVAVFGLGRSGAVGGPRAGRRGSRGVGLGRRRRRARRGREGRRAAGQPLRMRLEETKHPGPQPRGAAQLPRTPSVWCRWPRAADCEVISDVELLARSQRDCQLHRHHRHQRQVDHHDAHRAHHAGIGQGGRDRRQSGHSGARPVPPRRRGNLHPGDVVVSAGVDVLDHLRRGGAAQHQPRSPGPPRRAGPLHRGQEDNFQPPDAAPDGGGGRRRRSFPGRLRGTEGGRRAGGHSGLGRHPDAGRRLRFRRRSLRRHRKRGSGASDRGFRHRHPARSPQSPERRRRLRGDQGGRSAAAHHHGLPAVLSRPGPSPGAGGHRRWCHLRQRQQGDQRRRRGAGAGLLRHRLLDRRRPGQGGRDRAPDAPCRAHPACLPDRRSGPVHGGGTGHGRGTGWRGAGQPLGRPGDGARRRPGRWRSPKGPPTRRCCCRRPVHRSISSRISRPGATPSATWWRRCPASERSPANEQFSPAPIPAC